MIYEIPSTSPYAYIPVPPQWHPRGLIQPRELSIQPSWVPLNWKEYIGKEKWNQIQRWVAPEVEEGMIAKETATLAGFTDSIKRDSKIDRRP